jgi:hypothetical protein
VLRAEDAMQAVRREITSVDEGTRLADRCMMPTAAADSKPTKHPHDAPRATEPSREEARRVESGAREVEVDETELDDSYDNVACTD